MINIINTQNAKITDLTLMWGMMTLPAAKCSEDQPSSPPPAFGDGTGERDESKEDETEKDKTDEDEASCDASGNAVKEGKVDAAESSSFPADASVACIFFAAVAATLFYASMVIGCIIHECNVVTCLSAVL